MNKPDFSAMSSNTAWAILIGSAVFEAVWATALGLSEGFTKPVAVVVFLVALAISMGGLAIAMNEISIGTAYAVWTGIGAVLTVLYATLTGTESMSALKAVFLVGIVGCTFGLKLLGHDDSEGEARATQARD
ncbi:DMT family transporter [Timonella senegalensis]|jgi:quaternary ammonium compound-resistance protein SugE|uniref:DMT family transporter n=1 Tax=Timonella senegalensis TaxID=1465825 RepID=UPI00031C332D|nr:multidrug efflux SMR transporter [Timonella senegalensis]